METTAVPVAVVTGAAQGIGRKVAEALAGEGYALATMARVLLAGDHLQLNPAAPHRNTQVPVV